MVSRAFDLKRHLKTHDSDPNKFVLFFSNSLIVINAYFIGNSHVNGKGVSIELARSQTWPLIIVDSMYSFIFFKFPPSLMHPIVVSTQSKKFRCTDDPLTCIFKTCDPASLLRHRKRYHGYTTSRCKFDSESGNSSALPSEPSSSILPSGETSSSSLMPPQPPSPNLCQESLLFPASPPLDIEFWAAEPNWSHGWIQPSHPGYQHEFQNSQLGFTGTTSFTGVNGMFFDYLADPYQHPDYFDQRLWDFVISLQNF